MEYKSTDSISEEFVSTDMDILSQCPICKSAERYFAVNFDEKVLLCENPNCEYPFGYTDLHFVNKDEQFHTENEIDSITTIMDRQLPPASIISTNGWFDFEKLNKTYDLQDTLQKKNDSNFQEVIVVPEAAVNSLKQRKADIEAKLGVQQIKKMKNKIQKSYQKEQVSFITKKEWVKHLKKLQGEGAEGNLLKKEEISRVLADEADAAPVSIDTSSITVELMTNKKQRTYSNKKKKPPSASRTHTAWIPCNSLYGGTFNF